MENTIGYCDHCGYPLSFCGYFSYYRFGNFRLCENCTDLFESDFTFAPEIRHRYNFAAAEYKRTTAAG